MRSIEVDEAVYAAIWQQWREGDVGENSILRRLLHAAQAPSAPIATQPGSVSDGCVDKRSGAVFPRGFEVFRMRKGQMYRATALNGAWQLEDGRIAASLNKLSEIVGATTESAWDGWRYNQDGAHLPIRFYRDKFLKR